MNDKFVDAMVQQSIKIMNKACDGEKLSENELIFILTTYQLQVKNDKNNILPGLIKNSQVIIPLIKPFLSEANK